MIHLSDLALMCIAAALMCINAAAVASFVAHAMGSRHGVNCAADAAIADDPPGWWKQELIKAKARKDVAAEREG